MEYRPGPGLLVAAAFLGPGTLTTATVAGARVGYALLWVIPLAAAIAFVVQELAARLPLAGGRPLARLIADLGPDDTPVGTVLAATSVGAVVLGAGAFQAGNLAGASLGLTLLTEGPGVLWVLALADVAFLLLWFGGYRWLERVLAGLVTLMAIAYGLQVALVGLDGSSAAAGLVPSLPGGDVALVLALVGTTVVPYNLFLHGSALSADGTDQPEDVGPMRLDLGVSVLLGGLVTASVLLAAASTIAGGVVTSAAEMAFALRPLLGPAAPATVGVGLAAAGLSSALTAPLAAAWAVDQLRGRDASEPSRWVWAPVLLGGTAIAMLPIEPVGLIVAAQVANALVLPLLVGACLWVANSARLEAHRNGWLANLAGLAALVVTVLFVVRLVL